MRIVVVIVWRGGCVLKVCILRQFIDAALEITAVSQRSPHPVCFDVVEPNKAWVSDITYIHAYEGWLYLAVVLDLFSRQVVGWPMKSQMTRDLAIYVLLMAVWTRKPKQEVMVHSDQGPVQQFRLAQLFEGKQFGCQHEPLRQLP